MKANEKTRLETKAYRADPTNMNSYIYQQSLPKTRRFSHGFYMNWTHNLGIQDHTMNQIQLIFLLKTNELLQDPRDTHELSQDPIELSLSNEIDHVLNQEYAISASLSELDMMFRNLESEDIPLSSTEEETNAREDNAWITLDSI